jgi:hypothetical protein
MHFTAPGCLDAVCGYYPARGWAATEERNRYRGTCRECMRLYVAARPADAEVGDGEIA